MTVAVTFTCNGCGLEAQVAGYPIAHVPAGWGELNVPQPADADALRVLHVCPGCVHATLVRSFRAAIAAGPRYFARGSIGWNGGEPVGDPAGYASEAEATEAARAAGCTGFSVSSQ